jgi:hypothetical protein
MHLNTPRIVDEREEVAITVTLTIYSGHNPEDEIQTGTVQVIPMVRSESGELKPVMEAALNLTDKYDENTPLDVLQYLLLIKQGVRGYLRVKTGYDVT